MPEHVSIQYDQPGKCPICGMTLVPVSGATLKNLQPGGKLLYYTCPMPEHSDVRSDKPGKCPKCDMTLIPVMQAPPLSNTAMNQPGFDSEQQQRLTQGDQLLTALSGRRATFEQGADFDQ